MHLAHPAKSVGLASKDSFCLAAHPMGRIRLVSGLGICSGCRLGMQSQNRRASCQHEQNASCLSHISLAWSGSLPYLVHDYTTPEAPARPFARRGNSLASFDPLADSRTANPEHRTNACLAAMPLSGHLLA